MAKRPVNRRGPRGYSGEAGVQGPVGPAGPAGPRISRADVIAMVEDQFVEIRKEMSLQLQRMGQIQVQLDQIAVMLKKLVSD
jgi:hypothetical protein